MNLFEDNALPVADEQQLYTWKDATLRELVTSLRALPPNPLTSSLRHPHARFTFRVIFPDLKGRISSKEVGSVSARDLAQIISIEDALEPQSATAVDDDVMMQGPMNDRALERERKLQEERTLEELQIKPGDWLDVAVMLPAGKSDAGGRPGTNGAHGNISGAGLPGLAGWGGLSGSNIVGVGSTPAPRAAHWRGGAPAAGGIGRRGSGADDLGGPSRGRGAGFGGRGRGGGVPLNRRGMPRRGSPDRTLGGTGPKRGRSRSRSVSRSRSRSRSRSPLPRRPRSRSISASPIRE